MINYNKEINYNHPYYNLGGIKTSFDEVKKFILNPKGINLNLLNKEDEVQLVFEYIEYYQCYIKV